jgi:hypothetical protein
MKRKAFVLTIAAAALSGCLSVESHGQGPNGIAYICHTEMHGFGPWMHMDNNCTDAQGKLVASSATESHP